MPESALNCISSWKHYFSDYEINEWNESNYDVKKTIWTRELYKIKHFSGVSDYARLDILYREGGIYFDTDVEVIKTYTAEMLEKGFIGLENVMRANLGLGCGCYPGLGIIKEMLNHYDKIRKFNGFDMYIINGLSEKLKKYGLTEENKIQNVAGIGVYPIEYFSPKSFETGITTITENTCSIHHFDGSWVSPECNGATKERWNFYKKYRNDEYVVKMYKELQTYKTYDISKIGLKELYKIVIKRTIKKMICNKLTNIVRQYRSKKNGT
ncbi:hypothetical protein FACS189494_05510 [Spirochaetia bacterium]|nr:hypothetical protein FACS189494_05510 [Spirochaetia bacterium]